MAAQGGMRAARQAPKVLSERDDMLVLTPGRCAATGATAEGAAGLSADALAGAAASAACGAPGTRGRRGLPAKGASGKSKPKTQSGTRQKTPDEQFVFHDGPETLYRYVELPRRRVRIVRCESAAKILVVPERIDGKLVTEFSDGAFAGLSHVQSLACPPAVERVGAAAFAECAQLRRLVLPAAAVQTSPTWLLGCEQLDDVTLPAKATSFDEDFLASFAPRRVFLGARVRRFAVPERWFATLREFAIDADNRWIKTDGTCIYSSDGKKLLTCAVHRPVVDVASGCEEIARKAFAGNIELASVNLPESVRIISASAFAGSGLVEFESGGGLREVATRAFARCNKLVHVQLAEGLERVGDEAFAHCHTLAQISMPSSLRDLGARVVFDTAFQKYGGAFAASYDAGVAGAGGSAGAAAKRAVFSDDYGVVYKRVAAPVGVRGAGTAGSGKADFEGGACLGGGVRFGAETSAQTNDSPGERFVLVDAGALQDSEYTALPGTCEVAPRAFYRHPAVRRVAFPDGLQSISRLAFAECAALAEVRLPDSLQSIGERAFCGAPLASFDVPAGLDYLGQRALGIVESGRADDRPTLRECRVSPDNKRFFMHDGLLCEHLPEGSGVVLYVGPETNVELPPDTCAVAPFAFAGARDIERLRIPCSVEHVGLAAFAVARPCNVVEFQRVRKWRGQDSVVVYPPHDANGAFAMRGGLAQAPLSARVFSEACDQAVLASRSALVRGRYMVRRLQNSLYLERAMRKRYENELRESIVSVCHAFFKADERAGLAALGTLGFLPEGVLSQVIDAAQGWNNVSCMAVLLNMKHQNFGHAADFDL